MALRKKLVTTTGIPLPTPSDNTSLTTYLVTVGMFVVGILTTYHVGLPTDTPALVQAGASAVSFVVGVGAFIYNLVRLHKVPAAAITSNATVVELQPGPAVPVSQG